MGLLMRTDAASGETDQADGLGFLSRKYLSDFLLNKQILLNDMKPRDEALHLLSQGSLLAMKEW